MGFVYFLIVVGSIAAIVLDVYMIVYYFNLCKDVKDIKTIMLTDKKSETNVTTDVVDNEIYMSQNIVPKVAKRIHASRMDVFEFCHRIKNYDPEFDGYDKELFINNMVDVYNARFFEDFRQYVK